MGMPALSAAISRKMAIRPPLLTSWIRACDTEPRLADGIIRRMTRVAYMGPEGSFSEEASRLAFPQAAELVGFPDVPAVLSALGPPLVDVAVAPIEHSLE